MCKFELHRIVNCISLSSSDRMSILGNEFFGAATNYIQPQLFRTVGLIHQVNNFVHLYSDLPDAYQLRTMNVGSAISF